MRTNQFTDAGADIAELRRNADTKADRHELDSIRGDVARLERSIGELRAENDGLRSRCEKLGEAIRELNSGFDI